MPKYCVHCKLQGNDEQRCYVLHPKLYEKKLENKKDTKIYDDKKAIIGKDT